MQYNFSPAVSSNREPLNIAKKIHEFYAKKAQFNFFPKSNFSGNIRISNLKYHYNKYIFFHICRKSHI